VSVLVDERIAVAFERVADAVERLADKAEGLPTSGELAIAVEEFLADALASEA
jgi:hypothetical protein